MTLVASGNISIANATSNRSIRYEVRCNTGGYSLTQLSLDAGKGASHAMSEFYSFTMPLGSPAASDYSPHGACSKNTSCTAISNTSTATCSTSPGGCVESYSWARTGGEFATALSPTSATSAFQLTDIVCGSPVLYADFTCTMSKSGTSNQIVNITVSFENEFTGECL